MPSSLKVRRALTSVLPEHYEGTITDLGSGFGHMLYFFKKRYPKAKIIGYEMSFIPYWVSKLLFWNSKHVMIQRKDFSKEKISPGLCYIYLFSKGMRNLDLSLLKGSFVVSNTFQFSIPYEKKVSVGDCYHTHLYLYSISN